MTNSRRQPFAILLAGLLTTTAAAGVLRAEIVEQILVKVNGEIFTKSDLETRQVAALRQRGEQIDPKDASNTQLRKALDDITPKIMVDAVDEMLIVQRGRELGYKLSDDQFKSVLENIRKENKLENEEQFQAALKQENMSMADLRRNIERQMITQRVQQNEVFGKVSVSEEEGRRYYDAHVNEFTTAASVTLREILVAIPNGARGLNVAAEEEVKAKVEGIRKRALAEGSFDQLATEVSEAPSKANGGLIGPISLADLSPDLRKLIEPMKQGDITEPLRTPRGYQLLKLESTTEAQTLPFEQAREQISDRVFTDKRRDEFTKYLIKLRGQAIIDWKNEDVHKAYEAGLQQQAAALAAPASN